MTNRAVQTDIDIDFADRDKALDDLIHINAMMHNARAESVRHPTGVYFQNIPINPLTGNAAIAYEEAAELGYFKVDFLNNHLYEGVRDSDHLDQLVRREPEWTLLEMPEMVSQLAHIHSHFGVVQSVHPQSVDDLAIVLALMRPGKRHLLGRDRATIDAEIWKPGRRGIFVQARPRHRLCGQHRRADEPNRRPIVA
jgi:hypothetical protein